MKGIISDKLNPQALTIEEAETKIRILIKREIFRLTPKNDILGLAAVIIKNAVKELKLPVLKAVAQRSLWIFANNQYNIIRSSLGNNLLLASAFISVLGENGEATLPKTRAKEIIRQYAPQAPPDFYGVPMQKYAQDYLKENVKPVVDRLVKSFPKDPDDISGRNSLRNRAEMEVRYARHQEELEELKANGVKLIIVSTHADCSERCRPWQGRVYSLDGTSGTTSDGRKYVPLEAATDHYYTTKAGKRYKNGLFGFNCRHYKIPYEKGRRFTRYDEETAEREYQVTKNQRALERKVRYYKTLAIENRSIDKKAYQLAREKAVEWNKIYIDYSQRHNRAYDPSRTQLL
jgi:hypothetical protein